MYTFSVASSSCLDVAKTLQVYFQDSVPSDFASLEIDTEKSHRWHVSGTVFVDYMPLGVEVCVKTSDAEISVSVSQTSHNDTIRFSSMFKQMVGFVKARGLQASSNFPETSFKNRLFNDDDDEEFELSDDEEPTWDEKVQPVLEDTSSIRVQVREEAFRAIAQWASATPASHEALAKGFIDRANELSLLFHASSQSSAAETFPFAVAMRHLCEGCSKETRDKMLQSPLSTMMESASKPRVVAVVAHEYNTAMKALGKAEVSKPGFDNAILSDVGVKIDQVKTPIQFDHSKAGFENFLNSPLSQELMLISGRLSE
jgi:hypothetical protein